MNRYKTTKLIIIRGPSGAGKSTVARELLKRAARPMFLVSEDQVRKQFSDHGTPGHETSKIVATQMVLQGLKNSYDVIYEGILNLKTSGNNLQEVLDEHRDENYFYYLDVSFQETVKRHHSRPEKEEFDVESMKKWWDYAGPTRKNIETVITEQSSLQETIVKIDQTAKLNLLDELK